MDAFLRISENYHCFDLNIKVKVAITVLAYKV